MRVGIVGVGAVGGAIHKMFPTAALFDEPRKLGSKGEVNGCDAVFVCVPTPMRDDGSCDTTIVQEVVDWVTAPLIIIRSTVSVGTTRALAEASGKAIVFQPEYGPAETPDHPFNDLFKVRWLVLGGRPQDTVAAARVWETIYNSDIAVHRTTWEAAELAKYMENTYLALKVTFCNEFFDIANALGVDYEEVRELWLADPRIGRSHTWVLPESRGFGGRCLPKDLDAMIERANRAGANPELLRAVRSANRRMRGQ